jgi:hypothetical protein
VSDLLANHKFRAITRPLCYFSRERPTILGEYLRTLVPQSEIAFFKGEGLQQAVTGDFSTMPMGRKPVGKTRTAGRLLECSQFPNEPVRTF